MERTIIHLSWNEIKEAVKDLTYLFPRETKYFGVPRGGCYMAVLTGNPVDTPEEADVIIDDIIDSGATQKKYSKYGKPFIAPYKVDHNKPTWIVFPWEQHAENDLQDTFTRILQMFSKPVNEENIIKIENLIKNGITEI